MIYTYLKNATLFCLVVFAQTLLLAQTGQVLPTKTQPAAPKTKTEQTASDTISQAGPASLGSTYNKTFKAVHLNDRIQSSLEIKSPDLQKNIYKASFVLQLNPLSSTFAYKGFVLPAAQIKSVKYKLKIIGSQFDTVVRVSDKQLNAVYKVNFTFETKQQPTQRMISLSVEPEEYGAGHTELNESTVDTYYEVCNKLKSLSDQLTNLKFLTTSDLSISKKGLDDIAEIGKGLTEKKFPELKISTANDPGSFFSQVRTLNENIAKKEADCLQEALSRLKKSGAALQSLKFTEPDSLESERKALLRIETEITQVAGLDFDLTNGLLGTKYADFQQKNSKIAEDMRNKKVASETAQANKHLAYYNKALNQSNIEKRQIAFQKAIEVSPKPFADAHYQLALIEFQKSTFDNCLNELDQTLSADPIQKTVNECVQLYDKVFQKLISLGDQSRDAGAEAYYLSAKRVCKNRNLPFSCDAASTKLNDMHNSTYRRYLEKARKDKDFEAVKSAQIYFDKHNEYIEGDKNYEINQVFVEILEANYQSVARNISALEFENAWKSLLKIKDAEETYHIQNNYQARWETQAKQVFEQSLSAAQSENKRNNFQKAAQLLQVCHSMSGNDQYAYLFDTYRDAFRTAQDMVQKDLFDFRLREAEKNLTHGNFAEACILLDHAEQQLKNSTSKSWMGKDLQPDIEVKRENLSSAQFNVMTKGVHAAIEKNNWPGAEKALKEVEDFFEKNQKWLNKSNHGADLDECRFRLNTARFSAALKISRDHYKKNQLLPARDSLLRLNEAALKNAWLKPVSLDSMNKLGNQIGKAFLALGQASYQQQQYIKAADHSEAGLKLLDLVQPDVRMQLKRTCIAGYTSETNALLNNLGEKNPDTIQLRRLQNLYKKIETFWSVENFVMEDEQQKAIVERLRNKINASECSYYWNLYATNLQKATIYFDSKNYVEGCKRLQSTLEILKGKEQCQIDQSEARSLLNEYTRVVEFQNKKQTIENFCLAREYEKVLENYPEMEQFHMLNNLAKLNIPYTPFEDFIKQQKDFLLLHYSITRLFNESRKRELVKALLAYAQQANPGQLGNLGLEVGQHLHSTNPGMEISELLDSYKLSSKNADKTFKKGVRKGFKSK